LLERVFHLEENQTTVRRELLAGLTTFMTMAYIVVVNPLILSEAGMPVEGVLFATCISAAVATLIMGLWANYPIALAPGMSLNAYFTYSIVVIAALFLVAMFCAPLVAAIPAYATAPALILVGALMCGAVARVRWDDFSEAFPAFLTLVAMPLTFSIATGLSLGLLSFTFVKLGTGRHCEISPLIWVLTLLFVMRYAFLGAEQNVHRGVCRPTARPRVSPTIRRALMCPARCLREKRTHRGDGCIHCGRE
jgi:xanthine/uracil/vitamin C permease (AzgA family)